MEYEFFIDKLDKNEINKYSNMINIVFDEFVGKDYSDEGNKVFKDFIDTKNVLERLNNEGNKCIVAKYNNEIIGILETKNNDYISLFFVKRNFIIKGLVKTYLNIF